MKILRVLLPAFILLSVSHVFGGENDLLQNPSFEKDTDFWQKKGNAASIGCYTWHKHQGNSSFGIGNDKGTIDACGEISQDIQISELVKAGDVFIFTIWIKAEAKYSGKAGLKLEFLDGEAKLLKSYQSEILEGEFDWRKEKLSGIAPEGTKIVRITCFSSGMSPGSGLSFVWFDDGTLDKVKITTSSSRGEAYGPENVLMKNKEWHSEVVDDQWLEIDFSQIKEIGGLSISWGNDYPRVYEIVASIDGADWASIYTGIESKGGLEAIYFKPIEIKHLKIICKTSATERGFGMKEIEIKEPSEAITTKDYYRMIAQEFPDYYPRWLTKKQAYWTLVGVPEDENEAALCEDGTIEPHKRGFIIMPFLYMDGRLITRGDAKITQALEKDYLPIPSVKWDYNGISMDVKLFAYGKHQKNTAYARYTVKNDRPNEINGKLFLTIRPFQIYPFWQQGTDSFAPIYSVNYKGGIIDVNEKHKIYALTKPDRFGARGGGLNLPFKFPVTSGSAGDIVADINNNVLPESGELEDPEGFASGAIEYSFNLQPAASEDFFVAIPLHDRAPDLNVSMSEKKIRSRYEEMLKETAAFWEEKVNKINIDIPEVDITNTLKSNVAYNLLTKDGPTLQPGSRSYDKGWMRDGSIQGAALLRMGLNSEMKDFVNWMAGFQFESGEIPPVIDNKAKDPLWEEKEQNLKEYDSQGEFVWAILQYYYFTKDRGFLDGKLPKVIKALEFLVYLRSQTITTEFREGAPEKKIYYGLLPPSRSHEGYWLSYSYWDDFWALKGWKDAKVIAQILGRDDLIPWIDKEYEVLKNSIYDSIKLVEELKKIDYIPGAADLGDFDATSTAVAVTYCDELRNLPQPQLKNTFERYYKDLSSRFKAGAEYCFTPYEMRNVTALLYMGQKDRALELLRFMVKCRRPLAWNHLAEVVHSDYRFPTYIGDMPHTWVGAEYINAVRSLFVYEKDDKLILGHGIDEQWLSRKEGISVSNMPTYYGTINYNLKKEGNALRIKVWGEKVTTPPNGFVFKLPLTEEINEITLNGEKLKGFSDKEIIFFKLPAEAAVYYLKK